MIHFSRKLSAHVRKFRPLLTLAIAFLTKRILSREYFWKKYFLLVPIRPGNGIIPQIKIQQLISADLTAFPEFFWKVLYQMKIYY